MKSPWSLLGWLFVGLLALSLSLGLYYLGLLLGWRPWLGPAILWLPTALLILFRLLAWLLARPKAPGPLPLDPSNPLSGQWEAIKSGLCKGEWELYLLLGDDDESKRDFLSRALGQAEYQSAPAGPDGLCLWAAGGRAWLNIPAALGYGQELPAGGDWGHLMKLLPGFPGPLSGLVFLADPQKIYESPEIVGQILTKRLGLLPRPAPPWWLLLYPLENLPSGERLSRLLNRDGDDGDRWRRPFGLFLDVKKSRLSLPQKLAAAQSLLAEQLRRHLRQIDYWPARPCLAREIFTLQHEFRSLPLDYFSAEADSLPARCDGLFLAFSGRESPGQCTEFLLRELIPARRAELDTRRGQKSRRLIYGLAGALFLLGLAVLGLAWRQGHQTLELAAEAFPLLNHIERQPPALPPVTTLALASEAVTRLDELSKGPAGLYSAPRQAAQTAGLRLGRQLRRHLPSNGQAPAASFMKPLADWAGRGSAPIVFQYADGESAVSAFAGGAAHERVAALCAQWNDILAKSGHEETELIVQSYEDMMFSQWRGTAEEIFSAMAPGADNARPNGSKGLARPMAGLEFLEEAGAQLSFKTRHKIPAWIVSARELSFLGQFAGPSGEETELGNIFKQIRGHGLVEYSDDLEEHIKAAELWKKYKTEALAVSETAQSPDGLIQLAGEMFSGRAAPPERPTVPALRQLGEEALKALGKIDHLTAPDEREIFEKLFLSPPDLLGEAAILAAAAALGEEWNRRVVLAAKDLPEAEKAALLLGGDGAVAAFRDGPASQYLEAGPNGYRPREALGQKFPWSREFLAFINTSPARWEAALAPDREIRLAAHLHPVRAGGEGLSSHPLGVSLDMTCGGENFWAETYNQPADFTVDWSPQACGPLTVSIIFRDFIISKNYEGSEGLVEFLSAAAFGEILLTPEDVPDQAHLLNAVGAETVTVSLDMDRAREIIKILTAPPLVLKPPVNIILYK